MPAQTFPILFLFPTPRTASSSTTKLVNQPTNEEQDMAPSPFEESTWDMRNFPYGYVVPITTARYLEYLDTARCRREIRRRYATRHKIQDNPMNRPGVHHLPTWELYVLRKYRV